MKKKTGKKKHFVGRVVARRYYYTDARGSPCEEKEREGERSEQRQESQSLSRFRRARARARTISSREDAFFSQSHVHGRRRHFCHGGERERKAFVNRRRAASMHRWTPAATMESRNDGRSRERRIVALLARGGG